ncbi:hypothetical protein GW17_00010996 [Ensete ventricosum]|nr:hypothetical protein GW17_00010996 [Ensete ventricosum]
MPLLPLREIIPDIRLGADAGRVCSLIICNNRPLDRRKPNRSTRINTCIYAQTMKGERSEGVDGEGFDEFAQPIRHSEFLEATVLLPVLTLASRLRDLLLRRSFPSQERPHAVRRRSSTICGEPCEASSFQHILVCFVFGFRSKNSKTDAENTLVMFSLCSIHYKLRMHKAHQFNCARHLLQPGGGGGAPFPAEKAYWEWKVSYGPLLEEVNRECHLGTTGMVSIKIFFYDAYSKCVERSIFDGLKMDLVTFAEELLGSSSRDEHLMGARVQLRISTNHRFANGTLRKIGTTTPVIETLNWKTPAQEDDMVYSYVTLKAIAAAIISA